MADIIGYIGSAVVLLSFLMKDIVKLRVLNTIGCLIFVVYGVLLNFSVPIILTNSVIVLINVFFLMKRKENKS